MAGALVVSVSQGSQAEQAGMKQGDLITKFAVNPVTNVTDLLVVLGKQGPGQQAEVVVQRGRTPLHLRRHWGTWPTSPDRRRMSPCADSGASNQPQKSNYGTAIHRRQPRQYHMEHHTVPLLSRIQRQNRPGFGLVSAKEGCQVPCLPRRGRVGGRGRGTACAVSCAAHSRGQSWWVIHRYCC
jgi:hypothetical protein